MKVLYVGRDNNSPTEFCPGSLVCMSIIEKLRHAEITVQDVSIIRKNASNLPDWLNGTPILIDQDDGHPFRGKYAIQELKNILAADKKRETPAAPRQGGMPAHNMRMVPELTRQSAEKTDMFPGESDEDDEANTSNFEISNDDTVQNVPIRDEKITEQDLQKFMEMRKSSPAAANPTQNM